MAVTVPSPDLHLRPVHSSLTGRANPGWQISVTVRTLPAITPSLSIGDLPGFDAALDLDARGKRLAELFHDLPDLPGVLLTEHGIARSSVSRRYYLEMIGRYCGRDLYLPRPIRLMMERFEERGGALLLPAAMGIEEAVRRGLDRHADLVYEPLVVDLHHDLSAGLGARLVDFETLLVADSKLTLLRNAQMGQILDTVRDGLLLVGRDQVVLGEYSRSVEALFGTRFIAARRFSDLLADFLEPDLCELAQGFLATLFDGHVIEALVAGINPLARVEARLPGTGERRVLTFRFTRGAQSEGPPTVLVRVEDVTRAEELALALSTERERSERRLELAMALVDVAPEELSGLVERIDRMREALGRGVEHWRSTSPVTAEVDSAFREVHALKGEAGLARFEPARKELHALEDALAALRSGSRTTEALDVAEQRIDQLGALLAETRAIQAHFATLTTFTATHRLQADTGLLSGLARLVNDLAGELDRPARFVSRARETELPERWTGLLRDVLVQLVRNSLAHGVEPRLDRLRAGKPEVATLQLAVRRHDEGWSEWIFQDDGRGIDWEGVRRSAEKRGLPASSPGELAELLFFPGFSTADVATSHAGRGVGLDLVRQRVAAAGGSISVHSEPGSFCAFQILLPELEGALTS